MTTKEALDYFEGMKGLSRFLDVYPQAIYKWGDYPPLAKQYELEVRTKGQLKAEQGAVNETSL